MVRPVAGEHTCCGVVQEAADRAREKRYQRRSKPQPWIVLKLAVIISVSIIGYVSYVYVGRLCVPMLKKYPHALGSLTFGIAFLAVFSLLLIMTLWSYAKIAFTSPGLAKDYVKTTHAQVEPPRNPDTVIGGVPYQAQLKIYPPPPPQAAYLGPGNTSDRSEGVSMQSSDYTRNPGSTSAATPSNLNASHYSRYPTIIISPPESRYCTRENIVKPLRSHHCSACGHCVLRYDHHCPWIGQCVGARNHKFFVNFLLWTFLYCVWIFTTLIALNVRPTRVSKTIDAQHIVSIVLSALFGLFTGAMLGTHIYLICLNLSTVENLRLSSMKEHENDIIGRMFNTWQILKKWRTRRKWDEEWGRMTKERNMWWLGGWRENWESVMGTNIWWWFLPLGRSGTDGLDYPINPRFDAQGQLRSRPEWPSELR